MHQTELPLRLKELLPGRIPIKIRRAIVKWPVKWQRHILLTKALAGEEIPDWLLKPIDYSFRPVCYWHAEDLYQFVSNIKGAERKKMALRLIAEGRLDEADEFILADTLSDRDRTLAGQVHPALMGGEYLPDYAASEVEIARVTMASTLQDVISIRAHPQQGGIGYRVADEYKSTFTINPSSARRPLSLHQLIRLIDTAKRDNNAPWPPWGTLMPRCTIVGADLGSDPPAGLPGRLDEVLNCLPAFISPQPGGRTGSWPGVADRTHHRPRRRRARR